MPRLNNTLSAYVVSCSSDQEQRFGSLYLWGETPGARWLASSAKEAKMRVVACREKTGCLTCDAEVHHVLVERTKETLLQARRREEYHRAKCE